jgi:NAD(P)-dependent dehydrogenase (short-subunit alcohol dehydrogenase family)
VLRYVRPAVVAGREEFQVSEQDVSEQDVSEQGAGQQVWFVTGASRGLGRAVVEEVLAAGHRVVATARDVAALRALADASGDHLLPVELDVTDPAQAQRAVDAAVTAFGRLDVVVNNAGYARMTPVEHTDLADIRAQVESVFFGTVHVTKAALPVFRAAGGGRFLQVGTIGGWVPTGGLTSYQAAKFAVEAFSAGLAQEVAPLGIRVTVVEAGLMRTGWAGTATDTPELDPAYAHVGGMAGWLRGEVGREPIDPHKVARVLLEVAALPEPPLRLPVGSDAVGLFPQVLEEMRASIEPWAELGRSVDFD